ncbi:MAG: deoxyribose-phosphate aldolase [Prolixibacteraceae bacterium]|nr:deoxyribose-phosphate aldolase [Prolixibacteraceae bacterium]
MDITERLSSIKTKVSENSTEENIRLAFSCMDLTSLNSTDTVSHIESFTKKVNDLSKNFAGVLPVAAICIYPNMVETVRKTLKVKGVRIASVAGGFPSSMTFLSVKIQEIMMAVDSGADEIDIVMPLWAFLDNNEAVCRKEISDIKKNIGFVPLKVILETGALKTSENIAKASILSMESGADFIKTSTGKVSPAATPEAAIVMCQSIKKYYLKTGRKVGFKAAGGISTTNDAMLYLTIVHEILGEKWMTPKLFRIGASRLGNKLLSSILKKDIVYF